MYIRVSLVRPRPPPSLKGLSNDGRAAWSTEYKYNLRINQTCEQQSEPLILEMLQMLWKQQILKITPGHRLIKDADSNITSSSKIKPRRAEITLKYNPFADWLQQDPPLYQTIILSQTRSLHEYYIYLRASSSSCSSSAYFIRQQPLFGLVLHPPTVLHYKMAPTQRACWGCCALQMMLVTFMDIWHWHV